MKKYLLLLFSFLLIFNVEAASFSIQDYHSQLNILQNGDLHVHETITFILPHTYNEGYRTIRAEDFNTINNIQLTSATVNAQTVPATTALNGKNAEIIWHKTFTGTNLVDLDYTLKNRVEVYDDFAKICYEHFGANWQTAAQTFSSTITFAEQTRGKDFHFQIYSPTPKQAHIEDLSVIINANNVQPGDYIGGCYLFDKNATTSTNFKTGSAYRFLQDERKAYGSSRLLTPLDLSYYTLIFPFTFFIALVITSFLFLKREKLTNSAENIIPPSEEDPLLAALFAKGSYTEKDILAATILNLVRKNFIELIDYEKNNTILILKKINKHLTKEEKAVINLLFSKKKEVNLDQLAEELEKINTKREAKPILDQLNLFTASVKDRLNQNNFQTILAKTNERKVIAILIAILSIPFFIFSQTLLSLSHNPYFLIGEISILGTIGCVILMIILLFQPPFLKEYKIEQIKWRIFAATLKKSRLKEYPPASIAIWGEILVSATALGLASKVNQHLSELDTLLAQRVTKLQGLNTSAYRFYGVSYQIHTLYTPGNRQGFSSRSSGGYSSGGGGFSGGSSGGGGFR